MRVLMILPLVLLTSCGESDGDASRTAFDSSTTGNIARTSQQARTAMLAPLRPMTTDAEVLQGNPDAAGQPFVVRIRELAGTIIPPHSHPVDEHMTVVSGTLHFGFGDSFDSAKLKALPTGSYVFAPKGSTMFGYAPSGAVVQVHGVGPFHINWRHRTGSMKDTGFEDVFQYRRGNRVISPRGEGVIRQGYASGPIIQYEIEIGSSGRFMVQEKDLRLVSS